MASFFPPSFETLIDRFAALPGIGRKSAQRLAFHVLSLPQGEAEETQVLELLCRLPYGEYYPIECVTEGIGLPLNQDTKAEIIDIMELNPLPILIPCHRIVEPDFHPAYGEKIKEMLLALEKEPLQR